MVFYYALALSLGAYSIWIISLSIRLYAKKCFGLTIEKKLYALQRQSNYGIALASVRPSVDLSAKLVSLGTFLILLVNMIQTEPFQPGPSNLVQLLLMTRGRYLLLLKVMGQRSRSHAKHCCLTLYIL